MSFVTVAVVGGAVSLASTAAQGIIGASNAKKAKKTANRQPTGCATIRKYRSRKHKPKFASIII